MITSAADSRNEPEFDRRSDSASGAVIGALAGDAAGATLEFIGRPPTADEVETAMCMVGGGVWRTAPGQITDDGELTIALIHALIGKIKYDQSCAAYFYRMWYLSQPFDVGFATTNALGTGDLTSSTLAETIKKNANERNIESKANGSLMRASALGVWSAKVGLAEAINAARLDAQLTHPNPSCQWAGVAYVVAIRHLLLHSGDAIGAFESAETALPVDDAVEVRGWLQDARLGNLPDFYPSAGFIRIAFTHAFFHLYQQTPYSAAISAILAGGGDTDTNACIVGGLIGALHGVSSIPEVMRVGVVTCNTNEGRARPSWLHTTSVDELIARLSLV